MDIDTDDDRFTLSVDGTTLSYALNYAAGDRGDWNTLGGGRSKPRLY